jgi:hypothetical protein
MKGDEAAHHHPAVTSNRLHPPYRTRAWIDMREAA